MLTESATQGREELLRQTKLTVETTEETDETLIRREYTFSYADQFDEWHFHKLEVYETSNGYPRNWEKTKDVVWNSAKGVQTRVPDIVLKQLENIISSEEVEKFVQ